MITLTVTQFNGAPYVGAPLSASFGPAGGTIGRAPTNMLVLPDPEKTISRVHVEVVCRAGQFLLIDRGSNPVAINGNLLAPGQEAAVRGGEELLVGAYLLRVDAAMQAPPPPAPRDDPFAALFCAGAAAGGSRDPFANPFAPPPPAPAAPWSAPAPRAPAASGAPAGGQIPDDWDPFAPPAAPAPATRDVGGPALGNAEASLDGLFGLSPAGGGRDPLFGSPLSGPASAPNTMADADPLRAFGLAAPVPAASEADRGSDLYSPMPLPRTAPAARMHAPGAVPTPLPAGDLGLAWGDDASASGVRTIVRPVVARSPAADPAPAVSRPVEVPAPRAPAAVDGAGSAELLAALRRGLGVDESLDLQMSPVLMELLGGMVRESVQGSIDLLVARAALKREVRAEVTIIAAAENNPLKFSPSADVALRHLLGQPVRGFMPPLPAMRDAFEDLRAHQFGVMAGMKAALEGVLARFEPAQLESRLSPPGMLASLLPASRKARLWELFNELFQQLRGEASDDFQELFGRAFLRAYEQYIDELHRSAP
jgi:type VI secretion system FHA domain protein